MLKAKKRKIGLALGSGSARGWSHIGVIRALESRGIYPEVVCGTSVGSIVAAAYASNQLDDLEAWVKTLEWKDVVGFMGYGKYKFCKTRYWKVYGDESVSDEVYNKFISDRAKIKVLLENNSLSELRKVI